jgi:hypothetical protein
MRNGVKTLTYNSQTSLPITLSGSYVRFDRYLLISRVVHFVLLFIFKISAVCQAAFGSALGECSPHKAGSVKLEISIPAPLGQPLTKSVLRCTKWVAILTPCYDIKPGQASTFPPIMVDVDEDQSLIAVNYARSKRRIASLEDEVEQLKTQGKKSKS